VFARLGKAMSEKDRENDLALLDASIMRILSVLEDETIPADIREKLEKELAIYKEMRGEIASKESAPS